MSTKILGISAYYHDSAAALVVDGEIIAAAQEERFTRKKHDAGFPKSAILYCLEEANIELQDCDYIIFYDKPLIKFDRLLETYFSYAPRGFKSFLLAIPIWLREKLLLKVTLRKELSTIPPNVNEDKMDLPPLFFNSHHRSHAASAFYPSPFQKAAVLCLDGVGEWATSTVWQGDGNKLEPLWEINFPHSLGLLYSAFTYYCGFKVNSGEYKLMGLAPYGEPAYVDTILNNLLDVKHDGSYRLNMDYFNYAAGLTMTNDKFATLFGGPPRHPESEITQREMDLARSIQVVTEELVLKIANNVHKETGNEYLCLAGGVALNCVANGRLQREGPFRDIWIQPAAGDAGGALGAALSVWHEYLDKPRQVKTGDFMQGAYLGPRCAEADIKRYLDSVNASYIYLPDEELMPFLSEVLESQKIVGWLQGRMEFGPRSLGGRSIIADPRSQEMQSVMNLKIKYRESFRPFAPAVKYDRLNEWFETDRKSPYMLIVAPVKISRRRNITDERNQLFGIEKLKQARSELPAITHVDYSARIQTVHVDTNPRFHTLLGSFEAKTGCPVLINTSFNVRGEPIVCTAEDAYRCFMRTEIDYLVLENYILAKPEQPIWQEKGNWRDEYELD